MDGSTHGLFPTQRQCWFLMITIFTWTEVIVLKPQSNHRIVSLLGGNVNQFSGLGRFLITSYEQNDTVHNIKPVIGKEFSWLCRFCNLLWNSRF